MYSKFCATVCTLVVILIQASVAKPDDSTVRQELIRLEEVWNEAYVRGDAGALDRLCADDLIVTLTDMQVMDKTKTLAIVKSGRVKFSRYETSDLTVRVYENAAVVTGRLERTRSAQGREVNDEWRFTKVYIRRDGKWQVVAWHASTVAIKS